MNRHDSGVLGNCREWVLEMKVKEGKEPRVRS